MRPVALIGLCIALFLVGLDAYDLDTKGEPREGFTAWEIVHHPSEWALPRLNGEAMPEKPLVFPWLVALSTVALGEGGELAPRLPSAIAACGLVLVVFGLGKKLRGEGALPAVICATMVLVVMLARRARVDMTLAFFVSFALLQFLRALEKPSWSTLCLFWLSVSLGTLTKGPIGLGLPALVIATYLFMEERLAFAGTLLRSCPIWLALAGSWYAHGLIVGGREFLHTTILMENFLMAVGAEEGGGHVHGTAYYLKYLPMHVLPWTLYFPPALWLAWKRRGEKRAAFPLAWFVSLFVFFSAARGKRGDYLLPLMPAVALMIADLWRHGGRPLRGAAELGAVATFFGLAALVHPGVRAAAHAWAPLTTEELLLAEIGAAGVGVAPAMFLAFRQKRAAVASIAGGVALLVLIVVKSVMPGEQRTKRFVHDVDEAVGSARLVEFGLLDYTTCYYLRRRIPTLDEKTQLDGLLRTLEDGGYAIVSDRAWERLPEGVRERWPPLIAAPDRLLVGHRPR